MNKKIRAIGALVLVVLWLALTALAWFSPAKEASDAERRPLAQFPELNGQTLLDTGFMSKFEDYTLDQFPLRDSFRQLKSMFHYFVMQQKDNNGIYIADGYAAEMEYPLDEKSLERALAQFNKVYELYLKDSAAQIVATVVPDKGYYLAGENGYLSMDYDKLFDQVRQQMPWASYVDITDCLGIEDYYFTDTHWQQNKILPVAQKLSQAMGVTGPKEADFTATKLERPFYGVYYGQAALPLPSEDLHIMESTLLSDCTVFNYTDNKTTQVYDMNKLTAKDLYDVYLSGAQSLLRIDNPNAATDRELIVFRDSYGSSLVPLLVQDYATVTLVDIRYINPEMLGRLLEFEGKDVLFMYSSLVLNKNLI